MRTGAKARFLLSVILMAALSLTACGGAEKPVTSPTPTSTPTPTSIASPTPPPKPGGNQSPVIKSLTSEVTSLVPGEQTMLKCDASDPDGDALSYVWSANGGEFSNTQGAQPWTNWKAPQYPGEFVINLTVSDGKGGSAAKTYKITVQTNRPPVVSTVKVEPATLKRGETGTITCVATDVFGKYKGTH